jgi:hypothetical protein
VALGRWRAAARAAKTRYVLDETTTVATPAWVRTAVWTGVPVAGAAALLGIDRLADAVVRLPWAPFRGPFRLVQQIPEPQATIGALALGAIAGLVLAGLVDAESLSVRVSRAEVLLRRPGHRREIPRADVAVAFRDGDKLVLLGRTGRELAREPCHLSARSLGAAFARHGIGWSDADPYEYAYRRWVPDSPAVTAEGNAVFAARQKALDKGDGGDAAELRDELGRLGYVVRDRRKKQYWRPVDPR